MTPLEIQILLCYGTTIKDYPGAENLDLAKPAIGKAIRKLVDLGLLEKKPTFFGNIEPKDDKPDFRVQIYRATEQCRRYCMALRTVSLPDYPLEGMTEAEKPVKGRRISECDDVTFLREAVDYLWRLLDGIDYGDDWAEGDDKAYRDWTKKMQAKRWNLDIVTDGHELFRKRN